jgi:hypothetical protein
MCGRFSLGTSPATLLSHFKLRESVMWAARYNLTPGHELLTIVQAAARRRGGSTSSGGSGAQGDRLVPGHPRTSRSPGCLSLQFQERAQIVLIPWAACRALHPDQIVQAGERRPRLPDA